MLFAHLESQDLQVVGDKRLGKVFCCSGEYTWLPEGDFLW